jgi:hypothetical protein
VEAPQGVYKIN